MLVIDLPADKLSCPVVPLVAVMLPVSAQAAAGPANDVDGSRARSGSVAAVAAVTAVAV